MYNQDEIKEIHEAQGGDNEKVEGQIHIQHKETISTIDQNSNMASPMLPK
jgi:hypothetical protein